MLDIEITTDDAAAFIEAKRCHWCSPEQLLASAASRRQIRAYLAAGPNIMAHHLPKPPRGGMLGGGDVMLAVIAPSAERCKYLAGDYLRVARENRLLGYPVRMSVRPAIEKAAFYRRKAMTVITRGQAAREDAP